MAEATYSIRKHRRGGKVSESTGTLAELTEYYGYTLVCGNSYNSKIALKPRTVKSLVSNLNRSVDYTQKGSYDPDYYELITE
jgi:hypothetical protein